MTSVIDSSRSSGSSGPRPMISSVICSSIRTRSARVRARPSSSMTLPKISSIWRRTSTWLDRSSFGSRSWMTRFWMRNLTSRNDSRTGACDGSRGAAGMAAAVPPPVGAGRFGAGRAAGGAPARLPVGRSRSASTGTSPTPLLAPRVELERVDRRHDQRHANNDFFCAGLGRLPGAARDLRPLPGDRRGPAAGCPGRPGPPGC